MNRAALAIAVAAVVVMTGASGCVPPPEVIVEVTTPPDRPIIIAARDRLSGPVQEIVAAISGAVDQVQYALHEVPRGPEQVIAIEGVHERAEALDHLAADMQALAAELDEPVIAPAVSSTRRLADLASQVADQARGEVDALAPFVAIDARMGGLIEAWDQRGSRSQQAEAFAALNLAAREIERDVRDLPRGACTTPRNNRVNWAELLRERTALLADAAQGADGVTFDQLRAEFSRGPYGEDRLVADAESAACWAEGSSLLDAPQEAADLRLEVQRALSS